MNDEEIYEEVCMSFSKVYNSLEKARVYSQNISDPAFKKSLLIAENIIFTEEKRLQKILGIKEPKPVKRSARQKALFSKLNFVL